MRVYKIPKKTRKIYESRMEQWRGGLNKLVSNTQIKPNELSEAIDIQLVEDGKIQCPRDGQAYFGNTSGSRVLGLFPYYKSDGTRKLLRMEGTTLKVFNTSTSNWDTVSGFTYTTGLNMNSVMAYDKLFLENGTDNLTYYDGTSIVSYTQLSAPGAPTVTRTGSSGTYTFSYKITAVSANGETTGSTAGSAVCDKETLDTSTYMTVSWSAVTSAVGYNVYGRKDGKWYFLKYLEGNGSVSYIDKNQDTPNEAFTPPEGNSTGGQKGKYIVLYKDSLFVAGDPANPSRLSYSGGGDKLTDFTIGGGGGFIDIAKNDGQAITGMIMFKNSLLVFKERSIYQFSFATSGAPSVEQINPSVGCIAPRGIVAVENDIFFPTEYGIYTVGNEAGFAFDVLRTNELSAKVRSIYQQIAPNYIQNISAVYAKVANKNLVIFSYTPSGSTTNSEAIVYDRERLCWYYWTNIKANCWAVYKGSDGINRVLYGDDASGYVKEALTGTDDFGSSIDQATFTLKSESFNGVNFYKLLKNSDMLLRSPTGSITLTIIKDGVDSVYQLNLSTISPSVNFGHYTFGQNLLGESIGSGVSAQDANLLRSLKNLQISGRSYAAKFSINGSSRFTLLMFYMSAKARSENYRMSEDVVN